MFYTLIELSHTFYKCKICDKILPSGLVFALANGCLFWWTRNFIEGENKLHRQASLTLNNRNKNKGAVTSKWMSKSSIWRVWGEMMSLCQSWESNLRAQDFQSSCENEMNLILGFREKILSRLEAQSKLSRSMSI